MSLRIEFPEPLLSGQKSPPEALAIQMSDSIYQNLRNRSGKQTVLFFSGGSALNVLDPLAKKLEEDITVNLSQVVVGLVDERFHDDANTYKTITQKYSKFYYIVANRGGTFIDTSPHLESLDEMADWYNNKVQYYIEKIETSDDGEMWAIVGMGPDGHTAGIFPYPENKEWFQQFFIDTKRFVVGYEAKGKNDYPLRFSMTYPALDKMTRFYAFITGENKKEKLGEALGSEKPLWELPARYFQSVADRLVLYTDIHV